MTRVYIVQRWTEEGRKDLHYYSSLKKAKTLISDMIRNDSLVFKKLNDGFIDTNSHYSIKIREIS